MENLSNYILRRNRHRGAMTGDELKTLFERAKKYEMESKSQKEKQLNPQKKK